MPPQNVTPKKMPFEKYSPWIPLVLADRTWPNTTITTVSYTHLRAHET